MELVSLRKKDGQMQEVNGMKVYTLFYEAKVRYLTPVGHWKAGNIDDRIQLRLSNVPRRAGRPRRRGVHEMSYLTEF